MRQEQTGPSGKSISSGINYPAPARESARESDSEQRRTLRNMVFATDKLLLRRMLRAIGDPPVQIVLWNGQGISNHQGNPEARVLIRDRGALFKLVADPELYFGELYSAQRIEVQGNLLDFLETIYRVLLLGNQGKIVKRQLAPFYDSRRNTLTGSRRNIHHHYDIGNDFYKLWLDERMLYTCAYFPSPETSLEDAQLAKLDHVCRKLRLQTGRKSGGGRLRMGSFGAAHGQTLRRESDSLQHIQGADRLCKTTRSSGRSGWTGRVHRGRLSQRERRVRCFRFGRHA